MNNFLFSINVTIPIFLVILIGYLLRKKNFINENFTNTANKYVFSIALPAMLFKDISNSDFKSNIDTRFIMFCFFVTLFSFLFVWLLSYLIIKDKSIVGAFTQASVRSSAAVLGIAFVKNICGSVGMAPLMIISAVPLFNMLSVIILTFSSTEAMASKNNKANIIKACISILKNPIIISIFIGFIFSLLEINTPEIISRTIDYIAATATPMALIGIGGAFDGKQSLSKIKPTIIASLIKLIALPATFMPLALNMNFNPSEIIAILTMLASPSTISCYVMAKSMKNDYVLSSSVIIVTTLFSSITLTIWIFILKSMGVI